MLSETIVTAFLETSITGAGLVLAVYALVTPISEKIFTKRTDKLKHLLEDFENERNKITADAPSKDFKHLEELRNSIEQIRIFPRYLSYGILASFVAFMISAMVDFLWLSNKNNQVPENDLYTSLPLFIAILLFFVVGMLTIGEIFDTMRKEFENIKKRQKEIKETTNEDLEKAKANLRTDFSLLRFREESHMPIESSWSIRILHPERPIEKCSITYEGTRLPWWDKHEPYYEKFIDRLSGGNVRIPKGTEREDIRVIVWDGKKIIKDEIFGDIPVVDA